MNAKTIRMFRETKGLTQNQLAALLDVSPTAVTTWEKGQDPSGPALKLLRFLIDGVHPFRDKLATSSFDWEFLLSLPQWEELEKKRINHGFASVREYILWKMREDATPAKQPAKDRRNVKP